MSFCLSGKRMNLYSRWNGSPLFIRFHTVCICIYVFYIGMVEVQTVNVCRGIFRPVQRNSVTSREVAMPLGRALMTSFLPRLWIGGPTYVIHFQVPDWLGRKVCVCMCWKQVNNDTNMFIFFQRHLFLSTTYSSSNISLVEQWSLFFSCRLQMVALLAHRENEGKLVKVRGARHTHLWRHM